MATRASFKGFLRLSLVSVPVKAYTANASSASEIHLNQLHAECNSRIQYLKSCPLHGPVKSDAIVSGYEYSSGQYVVIDPDEVAKLRKTSDKTIDLDGFIPADSIDPIYYTGKTYYLLPDGPVGQKAYALVLHALREDKLHGIARAVLSGREQVVAVKPAGEIIAMCVLSYANTVKKPEEFEEELEAASFNDEELALTRTLIKASLLKKFQLDKYHDGYTEKLNELIQAKVDGQEIVASPDPEEPKVINLMEALKASVENARRGGSVEAGAPSVAPAAKSREKAAAAKPVKPKMAPSAARRESTGRAKRKQSG
ncbi:MAG: Ku protein [Planctomycetota bacterium]